MEFISPSDSRLAARAIKEGWPLDPAVRQRAIEHLRQVVAAEDTRPQLLAIATKAMESVEHPAPEMKPTTSPPSRSSSRSSPSCRA